MRKQLRNEFNNDIVVSTEAAGQFVAFMLKGPNSVATETVTRKEAEALIECLFDAMYSVKMHECTLYWCPNVEEIESACCGGFDVCCDDPSKHVGHVKVVTFKDV